MWLDRSPSNTLFAFVLSQMSTNEHELGVGFYQDADFDFQPNSTGDISAVDGVNKLGTDLSFFIIAELQGSVGNTDDLGVQQDTAMDVARIIRADERINEVLSVDVNFNQDTQILEIIAVVDTILEEGSTELIFDNPRIQ